MNIRKVDKELSKQIALVGNLLDWLGDAVRERDSETILTIQTALKTQGRLLLAAANLGKAKDLLISLERQD